MGTRAKIEPLLCELHAHTSWSDGALSARELIDLYGRHGFDVLAITDHAYRSGQRRPGRSGVHEGNHAGYLEELETEAAGAWSRYELLVIPGLELTYEDSDPLRSAHAVAVGLRRFVGLGGGLEEALQAARASGASVIAAHPYRTERSRWPGRNTLRFAHDTSLSRLVDRYELFNQTELFGWIAEAGLPGVASGDFHRPEHVAGWKTLIPCARDEQAVVEHLRSSRPVYLARLEPESAGLAA